MTFRLYNCKKYKRLLTDIPEQLKSKLKFRNTIESPSTNNIFTFDGKRWILNDIDTLIASKIEEILGESKYKHRETDRCETGPTGPRGLRGPQGIQGETGPVGPVGPRGLRGETPVIGDEKTESINIGLNGFNNENTGRGNVYVGVQSGINDKSNENVYIGYKTGTVETGGLNTFVGSEAGKFSSGTQNTYIGDSVCGFTGSNGSYNVFVGAESGFRNNVGSGNVFNGVVSGASNTEGNKNVFIGQASGHSNETGSSNVFIGANTGISNVSGNNCVCIGDGSDTIGTNPTNQIVIGSGVVSVGDNTITFPNNLRSFGNGTEVNFSKSSGGCLFPVASSLRWKSNIKDIKELIDTSKLYDLRPVTYNALENKETQIGLIAEEVEQHIPELVPKDDQGKPASVRYSLLSVLLLEEMKKLRNKMDTDIGELRDKINLLMNKYE
jgi:hypothetical protein